MRAQNYSTFLHVGTKYLVRAWPFLCVNYVLQYVNGHAGAVLVFVISLRIPSKHVKRVTIGPRAKRHPKGVSLAGR